MSDLYRLSVGPVGAAYYQQHFQRFETLGKAVPCWNNAAAFFTLAWLILRKLWRPAGIYAAVLAGVLALWWWGLHGRVPLAVETTACLLLGLLLCVVPGFTGTGLYYHHVRKQTLHTLTHAKSLAQARVELATQAITTERLHVVASVQALVALLLAAAVFYSPSSRAPELPDTTATQPGTGPQLVIPSVESIRAQQPELPAIEPVPAPDPVPAEPLSAPATEEQTSAAPEAAKEELSVVTFAQSVPVQFTTTPATATAAAAMTATAAAVAAAPAPAPQKAKAEVPSKKPVAAPAAVVKTKAAPAATPPSTSSKLIAGKYYLNAGVYAQASNVDAAEKQLRKMKLGAVRQTIKGKNGTLTRLYIGPFEQRKQAEQAATQAKKLRLQTQVLQAR